MRAQPQSPEERRKSAIKAAARYGSMGLQLFGACLLGVFIGRWIDGRMLWEKPYGAVFLTLLFMLASLVSIFRQLMRES
ncbi:MAG: AtpZ/AtpI family protein [Saprospiraceae bacterium]|nr:AtpZ/AtpI family protein [Saprospiraceae bacterium]